MAANFFRRFTKTFLVLINIFIALLFLLSTYTYLFNPTKFWYLGFLNLGAIYLFIALLVCFVFWFFAKKKIMLISMIAILLAWIPLGQLFKFKISSKFTYAKIPASLRVMSWNIEHFDILNRKTHPEGKVEMLDLINKQQPDIACFQEVVGTDTDSTAINYLPAIGKTLQMPYHHFSFNIKSDFDDKHHFGIMIYSKYPIINKHTISYEPNTYNNIFQYIDIVKNGDTIRIFNIHLQSLKFSNTNLQYIADPSINNELDIEKSKNVIAKFRDGFLQRKQQSDRIEATIVKSLYPVIVCGDFNDVPNSYAYHTIGKNLQNAFAEKGSAIGRTFSAISPTLRIDNIFVADNFTVQQYLRVKKKISDHYPIIADVQLNSNP